MNELLKLAAASILLKTAGPIEQMMQYIQKMRQQQMMMPNRPDMMGARFPWIGPSKDLANPQQVQQTQQQLDNRSKIGR
jgi:hypothetical protein